MNDPLRLCTKLILVSESRFRLATPVRPRVPQAGFVATPGVTIAGRPEARNFLSIADRDFFRPAGHNTRGRVGGDAILYPHGGAARCECFFVHVAFLFAIERVLDADASAGGGPYSPPPQLPKGKSRSRRMDLEAPSVPFVLISDRFIRTVLYEGEKHKLGNRDTLGIYALPSARSRGHD
jgi:hypothetical protein